MSFEADLTRLEQVVRALDRDDVPLEEALRLFEEGLTRLRAAEAALRDAEARVGRLVERADGEFAVEPTDG